MDEAKEILNEMIKQANCSIEAFAKSNYCKSEEELLQKIKRLLWLKQKAKYIFG